MKTQSVSEVFVQNITRYQKQTTDHQPELLAKAPVIQAPKIEKITVLIKPKAPTWEELEAIVKPIVNLPGLWITIVERYDAGYGAELLTAAEIAKDRHKKETPNNYFAASISKKSGNWDKTLSKVHETWEMRQNALQAVERLNIEPKYHRRVIALAWKLKGTLVRFVGMALEQGRDIKNPAGLFFSLALNAAQTAAR